MHLGFIKIFSTEISPEIGKQKPLRQLLTHCGAAFRTVFPLDYEPHPKYSGLCAPKQQSLDMPSIPDHSPSVPHPPFKKKKKSELLVEGVTIHAREKRKKKRKDLAAPAVAETLPLRS